MGIRRLIQSLAVILLAICSPAVLHAAESFSTLDLVSRDAALCLEIPRLDETWTMLESSPLLDRIRAIPAYQRLLESSGFQQFRAIQDHVARQTGKTLTSQLRALFGKSLVLAIYVPATGKPQGILLGEANDSAAIETALNTLNKLEPNEVISTKSHRGHRYQQRKKQANSSDSTFLATHDRWFAISDNETLIQDVIDRFITATTQNSTIHGTLRQSSLFKQNRQRLKPDSAAYLYVNARPWDRGLEEASRNDHDPINPAAIWKHVSAVSAALQLDRGVVCESIVELDTSRLPAGWSQFVATAAVEPAWNRRIPADALLAVSGHLEIAPLIRHLLNQVAAKDQAELAKNRRIAQSLLGGHELLDAVLPTLAHDFCAYITTRTDEQSNRVVLDAAVRIAGNSAADAKLLADLSDGLAAGQKLLAAFFSAEGPKVVTVLRKQVDSGHLSWLSEAAPFPVASGMRDQILVVAGSLERLNQTLDAGSSSPRLKDVSQRYFPHANQLIWLDTAQTRQMLERNGADIAQFFARESEESARLQSRFEQVRPMLGLIDSAFVAGQIQSDHVRVTFGGALDAK